MLATMWYTMSCRIFSNSCINQIQRMIRNFLWAGRAKSAKAKVAWNILIMPKSTGGLGIVDPVDQTRALLSKLVVRGLQPDTEKWKLMLKERIYTCAPIMGQPWKKELRWIFYPWRRIPYTRRWEDNFINGVWRAWRKVREGLHPTKLNIEEEFLRQLLTWNPRLLMANGQML